MSFYFIVRVSVSSFFSQFVCRSYYCVPLKQISCYLRVGAQLLCWLLQGNSTGTVLNQQRLCTVPVQYSVSPVFKQWRLRIVPMQQSTVTQLLFLSSRDCAQYQCNRVLSRMYCFETTKLVYSTSGVESFPGHTDLDNFNNHNYYLKSTIQYSKYGNYNKIKYT